MQADEPLQSLSKCPDQQNERPSLERGHPSPSSGSTFTEPPTETPRTKPSGLRAHPDNGPTTSGSSRQEERDGMQRSSTPPEGSSVRYTRTGRVSKATKGQRVHRCDECDKTYTRAEHLRRHKQNHKPGAFVCDIPGCTRSFYREDLLTRHKERHNDPLDPPTRRTSIGSYISASGAASPLAGAPRLPSSNVIAGADIDHMLDDIPQAPNANAPPHQAASRAPRSKYIPINELQLYAPLSIAVDGGHTSFDGGPGAFFNPSPPYSPGGYDSPINEFAGAGPCPYYSQPPLLRSKNTQALVATDHVHHTRARSPISAGSSTTFLPYWGQNGVGLGKAIDFPSCSSSDMAYPDTLDYGPVLDEHTIQVWTNGILRLMPPEERDAMEAEDLLIQPTCRLNTLGSDGSIPDEPSCNDEQRYLASYYHWIHPQFPLLHKATFVLETASPLLRAAVLALGAHALQDATHVTKATIMHERAQKVIKKRNQQDLHTYRVCDMQALLLHEIYAQFKSRRPPLQSSKTFEQIYHFLVNDMEALGLNVNASLFESPMSTRHPLEEVSLTGSTADDVQAKQRLLAACYVLERQQALLFGRQPMQCMLNAGHNLTGLTLPFPRTQTDDFDHEYYAPSLCLSNGSSEQVYEALNRVANATEPLNQPYDAFQSMLLLSGSIDPANNVQGCGLYVDHHTDPVNLLLAIEQTPRTRMAYHTLMLCRHTPVRDLLAVAGESWVMAEKLATPAQYIASQIAARSWAARTTDDLTGEVSDQTPIQLAHYHALQILQISLSTPDTGLLFQPWSLYLASLVIWSRAYIASEAQPAGRKKPRLSIPNPFEPRLLPFEVEESVKLTVQGTRVIGTREAKCVLLWVVGKIEWGDGLHVSGLSSGAVDVLGKLIARGEEEGWFA
ncbi:hypothetical protein LTR62_008431 [Meristemomyces frigidus]|uniref:C2H2-type domain-containing protein n=1 Tax=Meristemomyces frigidus TaxID=1508187 RepID=A0AAN7YCP5_9PEZI|nr:hypothetical protein LTR62_008431 [Meristemomyces frigidus]